MKDIISRLRQAGFDEAEILALIAALLAAASNGDFREQYGARQERMIRFWLGLEQI